ncbi:type IV secretory system conjugative DNA transfer family protein [Campylobacter jejuni]|nr:type IV secretory system conjugative DNA transfer family protein [Campylobacter jejuni]EAJ7217795.1 type IV secretory system conjugative DNA transfer family protein [Campylobacter jejuni]EIE2164388.1 type IV secretory system conjugative DNA transfer family protein [Campylobacter jejuni]EIF1386557.1 type IV secretory system conjugative DNA transfer family protein [Campylobacter jejuni]
MQNNKSIQIIFLAISSVFLTYLLTPLVFFFLNKVKIMKAIEIYNINFTLQAIANGYPKIWLSLSITFGICFVVFSVLVLSLKAKKSQFGEARFANFNEIKKMNLFGDKGIIIGKYKGKLLRFGGQQFVALGAPTRSGKGVGIVIPNLLEWQESAVVQDIKQECFDYTSKYRKEILKQEVYLFNPFSRQTHRYNPLTYIDMSDKEHCDSQLMDLANILYPLDGDSTSKFFNGLAQNLFIGLCYLWRDLQLTDMGKEFQKSFNVDVGNFNFYNILQLSKGFSLKNEEKTLRGFDDTYNFLVYCEILDEATIRRLETYFNINSDATKSGVMSSFNVPLVPFESETLRLSTETSDFDLRDLRKKKMTIYIGITPDQLANAQFILNIFWSQLILLNTKELPQSNKELKYTCLMVMDEFTAPSRIPIYQSAISFMAGYWLRSLMIYQSNSQLETQPPLGYGKEGAKTLLTNHACQIFYAPREQEDAEAISRILGNTTFKTSSRSINSGGNGGGSRSISEASRALMLPQELREMPFENELITIDSGKPILCNKAFYYSDSYFMDKFKAVSKSLSGIKKIPSRKQLEDAILKGECKIKIQIIGENNEKNVA